MACSRGLVLASAWAFVVLLLVYLAGVPLFAHHDDTKAASKRAPASRVMAVPTCPAKAAQIAAKECQLEQDAFYNNHKGEFWGGSGYEKAMSLMFSKEGGQRLFPTDRPITVVHVGAHLGGMIDRYFSTLRGPRLDDRLIMIEPNPANIVRLERRSRRDPRLIVRQVAAADRDGPRVFKYGGVPNVLGNGGKVKDDPITNLSWSDETGYVVEAATLDTLLQDVSGPIDFLMMEAEGYEARAFLAAPKTLERIRFMVFGCSERWKEWDSDFDGSVLFTAMEAAGLTPVILGDKRNVIVGGAAAPADIGRKLVSWGFCLAVRTRPSAIADVSPLSTLLVGNSFQALPADHPALACFNYLSGANCATSLRDGSRGAASRPAKETT
jgi:FkbM family methyltransferase